MLRRGRQPGLTDSGTFALRNSFLLFPRHQTPGPFLLFAQPWRNITAKIAGANLPNNDLAEDFTRDNKRKFWRSVANRRHFLTKLANSLGIIEVILTLIFLFDLICRYLFR